MAILTTQPQNFNLFDHQGFRFTLTRFPNSMYFVSRAQIPGFTAQGPLLPTPFIDAPSEPDKGTFEPLTVTFMIDEDFRVYEEVYNWLVPMAYPTMFEEHATLRNAPRGSQATIYSDCTLTLLTSKNNGNLEFSFRNVLPVSFGAIELNLQEETTSYASFDVSFAYERYSFRRI